MQYKRIVALLSALSITYGGLEARCEELAITDSRTCKVVELSSLEAKRHQLWADKVIRWSKAYQDYSIVVNKLLRTLDLYLKGSLVHSFAVDLGFNPLGDKLYEGDGRTPEGIYKVVVRKSEDSAKYPTKYHRALLLDYQNLNDTLEFSIAQRKGIIPVDVTGPGGHIEIHGDGLGEKGRDWTEGCIALTNGDMDQLFYRIREGIPIAIVKYYSRHK